MHVYTHKTHVCVCTILGRINTKANKMRYDYDISFC